MAKASVIQTSFNAGELSPRLEGRVDIAKYANGCRTLENFLPLTQGGAMKRSGFRFVKEVNDSTKATRLIPFEFSTTQAYILEFGDLYMRVYKDEGAVTETAQAYTAATQANPVVITIVGHGYSTGDEVFVDSGGDMVEINNRFFKITLDGGTPADKFSLDGEDGTGHTAYTTGGTIAKVYEIVTPYAAADVAGIQFAQSADVLYLAHKSYAPQKLERTGHTAWTITAIDFDWQPLSPENLDDTQALFANGRTGSVTLRGNGMFAGAQVGDYFAVREIVGGSGNALEWEKNQSYNGNNQDIYATSLIVGSEIYYEGNVYDVVALGAGGPAPTGENGTPPIHTVGVETDGNIYWRYRHSGTGYLKITVATDENSVVGDVVKLLPASLVDPGTAITAMPPANPTVATFGANTIKTGDRVFLWGVSAGGPVTMNNQTFLVTAHTATTITLDFNSLALPAWAAGGSFHKSSHRWAKGAWGVENGYPRAVTFFEDRLWWAGSTSDPQSLWASATSEYEDHKRTDLDESALLYTINTDQVNVIEWLNAGEDLIAGTAGGEFSVNAAVATDALTPRNVHVQRRSTYGSRSEVPPIRAENVLLFTQRSGRKLREFVFDEATNSFVAPDLTVLSDHITIGKIKALAFQQEPNRIIWCVLENGELVAMTYERAQEVVAWHRQPLAGTDVLVKSAAVIPSPSTDRDQLWIIVSRTLNGGTKQYVELLQEEWLRTNDIEDAFFVDSGLTYDGAPATTMYALNHLEGETVKVLADGVVQADATVSGGQITVASSSVVQVGLAYDATLETMRLDAGGADGASQGKIKRITGVVVRLDQTGKGFAYGPTAATAEELKIDDGELFDGDTEFLRWPSGYEQKASLLVKHSNPLPCTVTAIIADLVTQDR